VEQVKNMANENTKNGKENMEVGKAHAKTVKVLYNGTGGWAINTPRGIITLGPGDTKIFRLNNKQELHVLLNVLKQINAKRENESEIFNRKQNEHIKRKRFEIVEGMENLPEVLKNYSYGLKSGYTEDEEEAIKALCPDFYLTKKDKGG
jgi:hypothetical protein